MSRVINSFKRGALAASVAMINAGLLLPASALAQDEVLEEVVVSGIRSSLTNAMDIKRDATGVVDAISAEDIGKFPDTNLAESLQRITGVSIDRTGNEGNQVTVRGFGPQFNLVTMNGRQMPNSTALGSQAVSRSFNFREIASESVSGVEVHKTGRADVPSGGIGATIDIKTHRPFDFDELVLQGSIKGVVDTSVNNGDKITPEVSALYSQTFADDKFGVLLAFSHAERNYGQDRIGTQNGWSRGYPGIVSADTSAIDTSRNPTLATWRIPTVDLDKSDYTRERQNAQLVLQFAPMDNLTITGDYNLSRLDERGDMNRMSFWFDWVETGTADVNGTIIDQFKSDDELNFWGWEYAFKTDNDAYGLNVEWDVSDSLTLELDLSNATSHANPGALPAETIANLKNPFGAAAPVDISADFTGKLPTVSYDDSGLPGGAYALSNIEGDLYQERGREMKNTISQARFAGVWRNQDGGALEAINFGLEKTQYDVDVVELYSGNFGLGGGAMDISGLDLTFIPGAIGFEYIPQFSTRQFMDLVDQQGLRTPTSLSKNGIEEDTTAAFMSLDFATDFNGMTVRTNAGVRYEKTNVDSYTVTNPVVGFNWITPLEMSKVLAADEQAETLDGDYEHFLPNLSVAMELTDSVTARAAYSRTVARSNIDAMYPGTNLTNHLSTGPFKANQGNPGLLPYTSDNMDFSLEWYYDEGSYISGGYFRKNVDNFIAVGQEDRVIEGPDGPLTDPSAAARPGCPGGSALNPVPACLSQPGDPVITWEVTTPQNLNNSTVDGWEFNVQHMFGESGFGVIANYTMVDSKDKYDVYSLENDLALPGLSDSANLVGFYENHGFQARIAYNWRDKFLLASGIEPTFTAAYSQVDLSASYDITENFNVFVEGLNVTDEATHRYGRWENQIRDYEEYGPRYNIGVRAKF
ncbi:TonB-dependent receptor [Simiduia agarivorans]|uniref:TonB-dependent receptor n=1 Tax=Simiduia agarivorans (strain DSM 21679 / JCM 13881 / BCRC 17597 / SA1) TaxID=1117647 RepID=K4KMX8_SIMAS|nr:TonB-dependent receptor [Simiduia agarivorans]AFV00530.1 TonB-dependent receptor [Simiduia agarivorans SA1 = DSM 21679]